MNHFVDLDGDLEVYAAKVIGVTNNDEDGGCFIHMNGGETFCVETTKEEVLYKINSCLDKLLATPGYCELREDV